MKSLLIALLVVATVASPARAGKSEEALKLYRRGEKLYEAEKYEPALKAFRQAYAQKPIPSLFINIGQCFRKLGKHDLAIQAFERYLKEEPDGENRAAVEELLAEERALLSPPAPEPPAEPVRTLEPSADPAPAAAPSPPPSAPPPEEAAPAETSEGAQLGLWIVVGSTALMVLAGGAIATVFVAESAVPPEPTGSLGQFDLRR